MITKREWNCVLLEGVTERISTEFPDAVNGILKVSENCKSIAVNTVGSDTSPGAMLSEHYNFINVGKIKTALLHAQGDLDKLLAQQAHDRAVEKLDPNFLANPGVRPA
jgi:hypothetical protein